MNTNFNRLAIAAGVALAFGGATTTSQAAMLGIAGEALLVPLVVHGDAGPLNPIFGPVPDGSSVNTIIQVEVPSTIGFDTIPNVFTAPWTTPTNPGPTLAPADADLTGLVPGFAYNQIHWHWFDYRSVKQVDQLVPVTPDDVVVLDWRDLSTGEWRNQPGYMVIVNANSAAQPNLGAEFAMFGSAALEWRPVGKDPRWATIPVLAMSDGPDVVSPEPVVLDQVKYTAGGAPRAVSPLITGMRTNRSDGALNDITVFDLPLSDRQDPTIHVVWLDKNLGANSPGANSVPVWVFDSEEVFCSNNVPLPHELNVVYIPERTRTCSRCGGSGSNGVAAPNASRPAWTSGWGSREGLDNPGIRQPYAPLCLTGTMEDGIGFVNYRGISEYIDTDVDAPESAGVAFALVFDGTRRGPDIDTFVMQMGFERGTYKK